MLGLGVVDVVLLVDWLCFWGAQVIGGVVVLKGAAGCAVVL